MDVEQRQSLGEHGVRLGGEPEPLQDAGKQRKQGPTHRRLALNDGVRVVSRVPDQACDPRRLLGPEFDAETRTTYDAAVTITDTSATRVKFDWDPSAS